MPIDAVLTVEIHRLQELWIKTINRNGAAHNTGMLQLGDVLLQIVGSPIRGMPFERIAQILSSHWVRDKVCRALCPNVGTHVIII